MLYLAVIHAGIALWHHFLLHDNALKLMLPGSTDTTAANISRIMLLRGTGNELLHDHGKSG